VGEGGKKGVKSLQKRGKKEENLWGCHSTKEVAFYLDITSGRASNSLLSVACSMGEI